MSANDSTLILALETATHGGSVCLARGGRVLAMRAGETNVSHSTHLLQDIENLFSEAHETIGDVELFAAANGPGSFTGLRIGLATLKAFAATLERPCIGVGTLDAIAHAAGQAQRIVALLPAGRGEVYYRMFEQNVHRAEAISAAHPLSHPGHLKPEDLIEWLATFHSLTWAGEGARQHKELIKEQARRQRLAFIDEALEHFENGSEGEENCWRLSAPAKCLAEHVATLALKNYSKGEACDPQALQAVYVRLSDAEIKQQCRA